MSIIVRPQKIRRPSLSDVEQINSGNSSFSAKFHPDTDGFIACSGTMSGKELIVYSWNGSDTLAEVETVDLAYGSADSDWHPDGDYLAVIQGNAGGTADVKVYSWNGSDTLTEAESLTITGGAITVHWHPNGNYLAIGTYDTSKGIIVYSWNGTDTLTEVETVNTGSWCLGTRWSHSGDYLAAGTYNVAKDLIVYSWNGTDTLTELDDYQGSILANYCYRWTSDDAFIIGCGNKNASGKNLWVFSWSDPTLTLENSYTSASNNVVRGLDLFNDRYVLIGDNWSSGASQKVSTLYKFDKTAKSLTSVSDITINAQGVNIPAFDSRGLYATAPMYNDGSYNLRMFKIYP